MAWTSARCLLPWGQTCAMAIRQPMPSLTWCLLSESLSSAAVTEEEASDGDVGGMYLQAESSVMVPFVIMQMTKGVWQKGRAGRARSHTWAWMERRHRVVWMLLVAAVVFVMGCEHVERASRALKWRDE